MIPTRESSVSEPNAGLQELAPQGDEGNVAWLEQCALKRGILLLGGSSLVDFRVRVAQSQLRGDLTPSYWSLAALLRGDGTFQTVPLDPGDPSGVPRTNAVRELPLAQIDDPRRWPNICVMRFAERPEVVERHAQRVAERRTIVDLPELLLAWLAYAWAAGNAENPLARGSGLPSAAFVEVAHSLAGIELTPGLSSTASCPEAIWQAVKWWHEYYEGVAALGAGAEAGPVVPSARYAVRQRSAAIEPTDEAPAATPRGPEPPDAPGRGGR